MSNTPITDSATVWFRVEEDPPVRIAYVEADVAAGLEDGLNAMKIAHENLLREHESFVKDADAKIERQEHELSEDQLYMERLSHDYYESQYQIWLLRQALEPFGRLADALEQRKGEKPIGLEKELNAAKVALEEALSSPIPKINIQCETKSDGITGTTSLKVIRVEREDDGSFTAVTDYWPSPESVLDRSHTLHSLLSLVFPL